MDTKNKLPTGKSMAETCKEQENHDVQQLICLAFDLGMNYGEKLNNCIKEGGHWHRAQANAVIREMAEFENLSGFDLRDSYTCFKSFIEPKENT
jgi:hypothetical protein